MLKSQTLQIIFTIILLLLSSITFLFWTENKQHDYANNKSWWAVSFIEPNPTSNDLDFEIENYTSDDKFIYSIENSNSKVLYKNTIIIPNNSKKTIAIKSELENKNYIIKIQHNGKFKTLYK